MKELISAARIGLQSRCSSNLATQKPSGQVKRKFGPTPALTMS